MCLAGGIVEVALGPPESVLDDCGRARSSLKASLIGTEVRSALFLLVAPSAAARPRKETGDPREGKNLSRANYHLRAECARLTRRH